MKMICGYLPGRHEVRETWAYTVKCEKQFHKKSPKRLIPL
jgi:hypothetical protein